MRDTGWQIRELVASPDAEELLRVAAHLLKIPAAGS